MGINGLLPFVKPASKECHISEFRGKTAAIDSYCWLHKGAFGCAEKLAKGEETNAYVLYCLKYIEMLQAFRIKPIMVFDGRHLPAKAATEEKRRVTRNLAKKRAVDCLKLGKLEEARSQFKRCVDITPEMAFSLIKECRNKNIDCIVAPYEADSQIAYLNRSNIVDFVISEDSDLLLFGCTKILFKLDLTGSGTLVDADKLHLATNERIDTFSFDRFRHMCILSGCDYLESLPGIGLKKALKFLKKNSNMDIYNAIVKLPSTLNMHQLTVTQEYRDRFMIADATFRHQLVFDPLKRCLVPLTDPNTCGTKLDYCCNAGEMLDKEIAYQIALGNLNPFTFNVLDTWCPDEALKSRVNQSSSIWSKMYRLQLAKAKSPETKRHRYSPTRNKNVEHKVELLESVQEDVLDEDLLKMYSSPEPKPKRPCIRSSPESTKHEERTAALTVNKPANPFIKTANTNILRRLSAFPRTVVDETSEVTSEFFSSQNSTASSTFSSETSSQYEIEMVDTKSDVLSNNECDKVEVLQNTNTSIIEMRVDQESAECNDEVNGDHNVSNSKYAALKQFQRNTIVQKKMQSCRRPGLSKKVTKFEKSKNQQTLLSMFSFKKP